MHKRKVSSFDGEERIILTGCISEILPTMINNDLEAVTAEELARNRMFAVSGIDTKKLERVSWLPFVGYFLHQKREAFAKPSLLCECVIYTGEDSPDLLVRDPLFYTFPEASRDFGPNKYDWTNERRMDLDNYVKLAEEDRSKKPEDRRALEVNLAQHAIPAGENRGLQIMEFVMPEIPVSDFDTHEVTRWLYRGASADYKSFCLDKAKSPEDIKLKIWRAKPDVFERVGHAYAVPLIAEPQLNGRIYNHQFTLNASTPSLIDGEHRVVCKQKEKQN